MKIFYQLSNKKCHLSDDQRNDFLNLNRFYVGFIIFIGRLGARTFSR